MCGLVGMLTAEKNGFTSFDKEELKQMLILNSLRGAHSTGIAGVDMLSAGEVNTIRSTGSPYNLFNFAASDKFFTRMGTDFSAVIAHGRYATRGAINAHNAHPFVEQHITLAHNGVINNYYALRNYNSHKHIEVDSHLIAALIAEEGAEAILPKVEGAYVFMWYDSNDNTYNIARNKERPLSVAQQKSSKTLTFASEATTLKWNQERNNTPYKSIVEVPEFKIFKFQAGSIEPEIIAYKPEPPKVITYGRGYGGYGAEQEQYAQPSQQDYKRAKRKLRQNASDEDVAQLASITSNVDLQIGKDVSFILDDYKEEHGYYIVTGYSEMFPQVLFRTGFQPNQMLDDETLLKAEFLNGTIRSINPLSNNEDGYNWQVFVSDTVLYFDEPDDEVDAEERVSLRDVLGFSRSLTRYRLKELSSGGCSWCQHPIPDKQLLEPSSLIIYDVDAHTEEIVCADCAASTLQTFQKH